jgi:hypothetical protein
MTASWLQHPWCLYICWVFQLPVVCSLALVGLLLLVLSDGPLEAVVYVYHPPMLLSYLPEANNRLPEGYSNWRSPTS